MKLIKTATIKYEINIPDRLAAYDDASNEDIIRRESEIGIGAVFNDIDFCDKLDFLTVDTKIED